MVALTAIFYTLVFGAIIFIIQASLVRVSNHQEIKKEGGIRTKYNEIFSYLYNLPNSTITFESSSYVVFVVKDKRISRMCEDRAINIFELFEELKCFKKQIVFVGDAAEKCFDFGKNDDMLKLASKINMFQKASSIGFCAEEIIMNGKVSENIAKAPKYIRLSQAEQQLKDKLNK